MKKIVIIIAFLFVLPITAQKEKAILHFKDGTSLKGLVKITIQEDQIKFRKDKKSKKVIYNSKEVQSIEIYDKETDLFNLKGDTKHAHYYYKKIKNKETYPPRLLEIILDGKVKLYLDYIESSTPSYIGPNGMMMGGGSQSISKYYVSKENEYLVTHLGDRGNLFSKNFKKAASEYFKDCPSLVKKIQDKVYGKKDIEAVVTYYNTECFKKIKENSPVIIDSLGFFIENKSYTIKVPNKSANEIYSKMFEFLNINNHSIIDKTNGDLKFKITNNYISYLRRKGKDGHIGHKSLFEMNFKDGQCIIKNISPEFFLIFGPKSEKPEIVLDSRKKTFKIIGNGASIYNEDMKMKKEGILAKPEIENYFNDLIDEISIYLTDLD